MLFIIGTLLFYYMRRQSVIKEADKIAQYSIVIMGDSQMQRLKSNLFPDCYNFAGSGEHYYFTYQKLNTLLKNKNHSIKKIFLNCGPHEFSPAYSRKLEFSGNMGKADLKKHLYFISSFDNNILHVKDLVSFKIIADIYSKPDWGGDYSSTASNPDSSIIHAIYRKHFDRSEREPEFAEKQIIYLKKIVSLCLDSNIELVLISMPYHSDYYDMIDQKYLQYYKDVINNVNQVELINLMNAVPDPSLMSDATHLNDDGVEKIVDEYLLKEAK